MTTSTGRVSRLLCLPCCYPVTASSLFLSRVKIVHEVLPCRNLVMKQRFKAVLCVVLKRNKYIALILLLPSAPRREGTARLTGCMHCAILELNHRQSL